MVIYLQLVLLALGVVCLGAILASAREVRAEMATARRLAAKISDLTDLEDRLAVLNKTVRRISSRIGMEDYRAAQKKNGAELDPNVRPDPASDPAAWRRWAERQTPNRRASNAT